MRSDLRSRSITAGPALAACLVLAACGGDPADPDPGAGGTGGATGEAGAGGAPGCGDCHGTAESPAPPPGLGGRDGGAHPAHLAPADDHAAIRCTACHVVPDAVDAPGHLDESLPADVRFAGLAVAGGVVPAYEPDGCTVYCHGGSLLVEQRKSPPWTATGPLGCTSCHGMPPPPPHPAAADCATCHLGVIDATGAIVGASRHIDAVLTAPGQAHYVHLGGGGRERFPCTACHTDDDYLLRDYLPLEETGVCAPCHAGGTVDAAGWRALPGLAGDVD